MSTIHDWRSSDPTPGQTHTEVTKIVSEQELQALYHEKYIGSKPLTSTAAPYELWLGAIIGDYQEYRLESFVGLKAASDKLNTIAAEGYTIKQILPNSDGKGLNVLFARSIARIRVADPKPEAQSDPQEGAPNV